MNLNLTIAIPEGVEHDFMTMLAKEIAKSGKVSQSHQTDWIPEAEALNIMQLTDKPHMREIAKHNNIASRKQGQRIYYNIKNINTYIENGEPNF